MLWLALTVKMSFDLDPFSVELGWGQGDEGSLVGPRLSLAALGRAVKSLPRGKGPNLGVYKLVCPKNLVSELCHLPHVIIPGTEDIPDLSHHSSEPADSQYPRQKCTEWKVWWWSWWWWW